MENTINPIPETVINTPIYIPPAKPKINYLNLILISLCFVLFTTCVYLLGRQSTKPVETIKVLPTVTSSPTVAPDLTANWKTYTNSKYSFKIKYHPDLDKFETKPNIDQILLMSFGSLKQDFGYDLILYQSLLESDPMYKAKLFTTDEIESQSISSRKIIVSGLNAIKYEYMTTLVTNPVEVSKIVISMPLDNKLVITSLSSNIDQILSTFKFTENKDTYNVSKGTITGNLCYPSDFVPAGNIIAKNIGTGTTTVQYYPGSTNGLNKYSMQLETGTYHIKFTTDKSISGYYNNCGKTMAAKECDIDINHLAEDVIVESGKTISDISPCDFYYNTDAQKISAESSF